MKEQPKIVLTVRKLSKNGKDVWRAVATATTSFSGFTREGDDKPSLIDAFRDAGCNENLASAFAAEFLSGDGQESNYSIYDPRFLIP